MTTNDKDRFTIYLDNAIRHKLQILADADETKLGSYMKQKLQESVEDFEYKILEVHGPEGFLDAYHSIFGTDYEPLIDYQPLEQFDENEYRKNEIYRVLNGVPRSTGRTPGRLFDPNISLGNQSSSHGVGESGNKKEPSDE